MADAAPNIITDLWAQFCKQLLPSVVSPPPPAAAAADPFGSLVKGMLPAVAEQATMAAPPQAPAASTEAPRYWLVEVFDGEEPVVRGFTNPIDLADRYAVVFGQDAFAFPFVGELIYPSDDAFPHLLLDADTAVKLPSGNHRAEIIAADFVGAPRDTFYVGPFGVSQPQPRRSFAQAPPALPPRRRRRRRPDEDDDDSENADI